MTKKLNIRYTSRMRKAEEELDAFLHGVNGGPALNILKELQ
jgi:hypothetical protein